jgi:hypothetical protein
MDRPKGVSMIDSPNFLISVISGNPRYLNCPTKLYQMAFQFWKERWGKIFSDLGHPEYLRSENFERQTFIICFHTSQKILGFVAGTLFDTAQSETWNHPYFNTLPLSVISELKSKAPRSIMSGEYLSCDDEMKGLKKKFGYSAAEFLIALHLHKAKSYGMPIVIGTGAVDKGVDKMCHQFGYQDRARILRLGLNCSLMTQEASHCILPTNDIGNFNLRRVMNQICDYTQLQNQNSFPQNNAA